MGLDIQKRGLVPGEGPIGVFDSGIGGLTVVAALHRLLPGESIFYVGDTARVPYGGKSQETIERYSVEISKLLLSENAKMVVVACNTSSALALAYLRNRFSVPVLGVIQPGAAAAIGASRNKRIGVIGTRATIASRAYDQAIQAICAEVQVFSMACPLLVPLIEEGMFRDEMTDLTLRRYLEPLLAKDIDTLVLGCTHYPLLREAITRLVGSTVTLVDSAQNCALAVQEALLKKGGIHEGPPDGNLRVALTDATEGFLRVAEKVLGLEIGDVELLGVRES
jgi:glutamate racemase